MKLTTLLIALLAGVAQAAGIPEKHPTDQIIIGKPSSSDNKQLIFDKGSGAANPRVRFNISTGQLEFANDGVSFKAIGSGGGGGSGIAINGGINGDFESGALNWTASGGSFTQVTVGSNLLFDKKSGVFNSSGAAQTLTNDLVNMSDWPGLKGTNGAAACWFKTTATDYLFQVTDGTNILASRLIAASSVATKQAITFPFPNTGGVKIRILSQSNAADLAIDNCFLGSNELIAISQAQWLGKVTYSATGTTSTVSTTSPTDFTQTGATVTVLGSGITAASGSLIGFNLASMQPGVYKIVSNVAQVCDNGSGSSSSCQTGMSSVTNSFSNGSALVSVQTGGGVSVSVGMQSYVQTVLVTNTTGATTWRMVGTAQTGSGEFPSYPTQDMSFDVYFYPSESQVAIKPDQVALSWSGYHTVSSGWDTNSATYADPNTGTGVALVELTNRNFGTVVTEASGLPGITWTASRIGRYKVCAGINGLTGASQDAGFQLVDGSNNIIDPGTHARNTGNTNFGAMLCGIQTVSAAGPVTTKVRVETASGTSGITSLNVPAPSAAIRWSIFGIDYALPAPLLVNSVVTPLAGVTNVVSFEFAGNSSGTSVCSSDPCVVYRNSGGLTSVEYQGSANYVAHFSAGTFSVPPVCLFTSLDIAGGIIAANTVRATTTTVGMSTFNAAGSQTNEGMAGLCIGPK